MQQKQSGSARPSRADDWKHNAGSMANASTAVTA